MVYHSITVWTVLLNLRINFYLLQTFCPHLGSFCVGSSFTTFWPNFTSGLLQVILPRPRIGMLSLVTVSPVITAFHSCCLLHYVFDQVNLWPAWVGFETAIFWQCSPGTVETQRLYLRHGPRRAIKDGFFGLINPYLVFQSRVRAEFSYLSLIGIILRWGFLIYSSRWTLSEDSGFKSYPSRLEVYLVKNVVRQTTTMEGSNYWGYGYKTQHSYPRSR